MSIQKFNYENTPISFEFKDGNKMINATEMAKPFGKLVAGFLRTKSSKEFIKLLEYRYADLHIGREVLRIVKGGDAINDKLQGTWMDEKLALKFAAWLSPSFELWVYDRIQELLTTGKTELSNQRPTTDLIQAIRLIADKLENQQQDIEKNTDAIEDIKDAVAELEAKITSVDDNYYTIAGFCSLHKIPCPLHQAKDWGKKATALSRQQKMATGTAHDERYGKVRTYHQDILKQIIS